MQFLKTFASDRSHMKVIADGSAYIKPPPPFPPISVIGITELQSVSLLYLLVCQIIW